MKATTKKAIKAVVASMKAEGRSNQEIEDNFKAALKLRSISVDAYSVAMEEIYK